MPSSTALASKPNGRKPHVPTQMSRKKADELAKRNDTPLDVMVDNMLFWRNKATELESLLMERLDRIAPVEPGDAATGAESIVPSEEVARLLGEVKEIGEHFLAARKNSQQCAVDAAPYVRPRISPVHLKGSSNTAAKLIRDKTPASEAIASYLESLQVIEILPNEPDDSNSQTADLSEATDGVAS